MLVMGGIIGSGIFLNPAEVARAVSSPFWIVGVWLIGGSIAIAGAFVYAELAARRPEVGGQYAYLRDAWGPMPAFLYGWALLLVIQSGGMAAVAITFARYFGELTRLAVPDGAVAAAVLALLTAINCLGVRAGATVQSALMVMKIVAIAALVACGLLLAPWFPAATSAAYADARHRPARRARRGADAGDVRLWRLADGELRRRRDARSAPRSRARAALRRARRGRPLHRRRLHLRRRTRASGPGRNARARDGGDAARSGRDRRDPDRARHRDLGARLPQPGHADHAARLFRDGRGPALLPAIRQGECAHPRSGLRDPAAGRGVGGDRADRHLRANPELCRLGRFHLLRLDRRGLAGLPPARPGAALVRGARAIPGRPGSSSWPAR